MGIKGSWHRPYDKKKWDKNWENALGKKAKQKEQKQKSK